MKNKKISRRISIGALAMLALVATAGCAGHPMVVTAQKLPPAPPYTPKPISQDQLAAMNAAKANAAAMQNMTPDQRTQYLQTHPTAGALPPMPPRGDAQ